MNDDGGYTRQNKKRFCIHSKGIGLCALLFSTEINNKKSVRFYFSTTHLLTDATCLTSGKEKGCRTFVRQPL
jgi:hypothetical protein